MLTTAGILNILKLWCYLDGIICIFGGFKQEKRARFTLLFSLDDPFLEVSKYIRNESFLGGRVMYYLSNWVI